MSVSWTDEQLCAITGRNQTILTAAGAGSGKTAVLVERIIRLITEDEIDIDRLLVVTFTNAAATEMKEKIIDAINKKMDEDPHNNHLKKQLSLINKAQICTIHSFCFDIIRNNFHSLLGIIYHRINVGSGQNICQ